MKRRSPSSLRRNKKKVVVLSKSNKPEKKYMVKVDNKTIHFGATGYEDFTIHGDETRKSRYISRHRKREKWGVKTPAIKTPGWWSRWLLWNKRSLQESIKDIEKKNNVVIRKQ
jgi:hypothetical protein